MTRHEHQSQRVVGPACLLGVGEAEPPRRGLIGRIDRVVAQIAAQPIECLVAGGDGEPGSRALRCALEGPLSEGCVEGVLDGILDEIEPRRAEETREPCRDLAGLAAEEIADERVRPGHRHHSSWIWRTSIRPP